MFTRAIRRVKRKIFGKPTLLQHAESLAKLFSSKSYIGELTSIRKIGEEKYSRIISYFLRKGFVENGMNHDGEKHIYYFKPEMYEWLDLQKKERERRIRDSTRLWLDVVVIIVLAGTFIMSSYQLQTTVEINRLKPSITFGTDERWGFTAGNEYVHKIRYVSQLNRTDLVVPFVLKVHNIGLPPVQLISTHYESKCGENEGQKGSVRFNEEVINSGEVSVANGTIRLIHSNPGEKPIKEILPCEIKLNPVGVNVNTHRVIKVINGVN